MCATRGLGEDVQYKGGRGRGGEGGGGGGGLRGEGKGGGPPHRVGKGEQVSLPDPGLRPCVPMDSEIHELPCTWACQGGSERGLEEV